jgi:hypothetical protein
MRTSIVLLALAFLVPCAASALSACSSSDNSQSTGGSDASVDHPGSDGNGGGDSSSTDSANDSSSGDDGGTDAGDAGCSSPSTLHPPKIDAGPTIYCPLSGVDGGKNVYCTPGTEHCCEPTQGTASCDPIASACGGGDTDWQCQDPVADCPIGQQCCAPGATLVINADPSCANYATSFHSTTCAQTCANVDLVMCTSDGECPNGQTCTPFRTNGAPVGACH